MNRYQQSRKWLKLIAFMLLLPFTFSAVQAASFCCSGNMVDMGIEALEKSPCHTDDSELDTNLIIQDQCCSACFTISLPSVAFNVSALIISNLSFKYQFIQPPSEALTPLYRPPIIRLS